MYILNWDVYFCIDFFVSKMNWMAKKMSSLFYILLSPHPHPDMYDCTMNLKQWQQQQQPTA